MRLLACVVLVLSLSSGFSERLLDPESYVGVKSWRKDSVPNFHSRKINDKTDRDCTNGLLYVNNAKVKCANGICKVHCFKGFNFADGVTYLEAVCVNYKWVAQNSKVNDITDCQPICDPPCQNNGICLAPDKCQCAENYYGSSCQKKRQVCLNKPLVPKNSRMSCNSVFCSFTCIKGYTFPDGTTITNMKCDGGNWVPARQDYSTIPDCYPTCNPPCSNGGTCVSLNTCECLENFRGPQCQYATDRCSPKKLKFNGGYNCHGDGDRISCQLYCPKNVEFEFAPATLYECEYSEGYFKPENVPQCKYADGKNQVVLEAYRKTQSITSDRKSTVLNKDENIQNWAEILSQFISSKEEKSSNNLQTSFGTHPLHPKTMDALKTRLPVSGTCFTWGGNNVKTFDGVLYQVPLQCSHILIKDKNSEMFTVILRTCPPTESNCTTSLNIFIQDLKYSLSNEGGSVKLFTLKKVLPIPVQLMGVKITHSAQFLKIDLDTVGVVIMWDREKFISVEARSDLWNTTSGLCGTLDSNHENDFMSKEGNILSTSKFFVDSWKVFDENEGCPIDEQQQFLATPKCSTDVATHECEKLLNSAEMQECFQNFDKTTLAKKCIEDYCNCNGEKLSLKCNCETMSVLAAECQRMGTSLKKGWRRPDLCPMECPENQEYMSCGPGIETSCGLSVENIGEYGCQEGCFCSKGLVRYNGNCIAREECPCRLRNKDFEGGSIIKRDCNTCKCESGVWNCTDTDCGARCAAIGDPHYTTFDGKKYDFMGKCSYYLIKMDNVSIEAENVKCSGKISEALNYKPVNTQGSPSCTRSVTINVQIEGTPTKIKLDQGLITFINDKEVTEYPKFVGDGILTIRYASSLILSIEFSDGMRIWWDGISRVYIDVPSTYRDKTQGLCGTFNSNVQDDFLTLDGDIEESAELFAEKWRTKDVCEFSQEIESPPHSCRTNIERKESAERLCSRLLSDIFEGCHWAVDPAPFFEDCMYDVCACEGDPKLCYCPILAAYQMECNSQGIVLNWRHFIKECGVECPAGQIYDACGNSCLRTCGDIASSDVCRGQCVEGCRCPNGQYLNENNECVAENQCQCLFEGLYFNTGYKEVRPGRRFLELCECQGGRWDCDVANPRDRELYPPASSMKTQCAQKQYAEFTKCVPKQLKTCKNMHNYEEQYGDDCKPGCICMPEFVLDTVTHTCVKPENCSCHHAGKSFTDGESYNIDCNTCVCKAGKWNCSSKKCPSQCSVWGDSHFTTFDKLNFDFQGACDYVFAKGTLFEGDGFSIIVQNVLCGTTGVTCSKSLKISLFGQITDSIVLSSNTPDVEEHTKILNTKRKGYAIYKSGTLTTIEVTELGLQIKWDHGTRIYLKLSDRWYGKTSGLCGNNNGDPKDDMQNPSKGIESSALLFGHSWRLHEFCTEPTSPTEACVEHPERKMWAHTKCGVLKSRVFQACHSEVPVDKFYDRCLFDTCACDSGGDCECLCTALAAYAYECSMKGAPIKWRTPDLCPMQCNTVNSVYEACMPTCPLDTCDSFLERNLLQKICSTESCVEGCSIEPCQEGYIYTNETFSECIAVKDCKPVCLEKDGKIFYEGEITHSDDCHTCRCSRQKEICSGAPCSQKDEELSSITERPYSTEESSCVQGWTDWSNTDQADTVGSLKENDIERIPKLLNIFTSFGYGSCQPEFMKEIQCRVVSSNLYHNETDDNSFCTLEKGLICIGTCNDYEIRVYCDCTGVKDEVEKFDQLQSKPPICDDNKPRIEYNGDCFKFLECVQQPDGSWDYEQKICEPFQMFNPLTSQCDSITSVEMIKPDCANVSIDIESSTDLPAETSTESFTRECDPEIPYAEHPQNCFDFRQCAQQSDLTWAYVDKTCGPSMMFNPVNNVCDFIKNVLEIKPQCGTGEPEKPEVDHCPEGQRFSSCAIPCGRACHYYEKRLYKKQLCKPYSEPCKEGCVDDKFAVNCSSDQLWRDKRTCVEPSDCPCLSFSGKFVKPNQVFQESDCMTCQCLDNTYVCSKSECHKEIEMQTATRKPIKRILSKTRVKKIIIIPDVVSPPKQCENENLIPLIEGETPLPDSAFTSSSSLGSSFLPQYCKINGRPTEDASGSWSPMFNDQNQYLQIAFDKPTPVHGIVMQGSPLFDQYVTTFKVLYSLDGVAFHYVNNKFEAPQICNGPIDPKTPMQTMFAVPVEAKIIRICPMEWHGGISLRVELLGCSFEQVQSRKTTTIRIKHIIKAVPQEYIEPLCDDPMGIENDQMSPKQVSASSIRSNVNNGGLNLLQMLKLSSSTGWQPIIDALNEFVLFDFLEMRNLTGIQIKGGQLGWVRALNVAYSHNGYIWNTILSSKGNPKMFLANTNAKDVKLILLKNAVQARYLKILPTKWENTIDMRIEPLGCFIPYTKDDVETTEPAEIVTTETGPIGETCLFCPGIEKNTYVSNAIDCECQSPKYWNGSTCVDRSLCPCVVGSIQYEVGAQYESDECMQCVCVLGGVSHCKPHVCPPCKDELRPVKLINCGCACEPCPEFQKLCPSSGDCIFEELWCNGIEDCSDDERNCTIKTPTAIESIKPAKQIRDLEKCAEPHCPPGMEIRLEKSRRKLSQIFESSLNAVLKKARTSSNLKSMSKTSRKDIFTKAKYQSSKKGREFKKEKNLSEKLPRDNQCVEFTCVPISRFNISKVINQETQCPRVECPDGYTMEKLSVPSNKARECTTYKCVAPPSKDAVCTVNGRSVNTFDGVDFKHDICNHILAKDLTNNEWSIKWDRTCNGEDSYCEKRLIISEIEKNITLVLYTNFTALLNGYQYSVRQLENSPHLASTFKISQPGNSVLVISVKYAFWVSFDAFGNTKIGVSSTNSGTVEGLCGFYNDIAEDDKRMPDGKPARSTAEFADAWGYTDPLLCIPRKCDQEIQEVAWEICNSIKDKIPEACPVGYEYNRFISACMDSMCDCITSSDKKGMEEQCKCDFLQNFIKDCIAMKPEVDVSNWRTLYDCKISCPSPLVYNECYRRKCEPSCENFKSEKCPIIQDTCFVGCYCPDGMVRKNNTCVYPKDCMDCVCDGNGKTRFVTYDGQNFTFNGNCTYLLSRSTLPKPYSNFEVHVTLGNCGFANKKRLFKGKTKSQQVTNLSSCIQALRINYKNHTVVAEKPTQNKNIISIDNMLIKYRKIDSDWIKLTKKEDEVVFELVGATMQIKISHSNMDFSILVPSITYNSKLEGLCGNCDGDIENELRPNPKLPDLVTADSSLEQIIQSWQEDDSKSCMVKDTVDECKLPSSSKKSCMKILDQDIFGQCHILVDPTMYIQSCEKDLCENNQDDQIVCNTVHTYTKDCLRHGICINWRRPDFCSHKCPQNLIYTPCQCLRTCDGINSTRTNSLRESCVTDQIDVCNCPDGQVWKDDKCIPEEHCIQCENGHFYGDTWLVDKCTTCKCESDGSIICTKKECPIVEQICEEDFTPIEIPRNDECCPKFICVPKPTVLPATECLAPLIPNCTPDQVRKSKIGADSCIQYFCECIPLTECPPTKDLRELRAGEKVVNKTLGCCPELYIECDKTTCPEKTNKCEEPFVEVTKNSDEECCPEFACEPPENTCLVYVDGKIQLKNLGDKWPSVENLCLSHLCTYGTNKLPVILDEEEACNTSCKEGFAYKINKDKCCGECIQSMCNFNETFYHPGEKWYSDDNCTTYSCDIMNGENFFILSQEQTCPDISSCPPENRYKDDCCSRCKIVSESKHNCQAHATDEESTVGMIEVHHEIHGVCRNEAIIAGMKECQGLCSSGSKLNPVTFEHQSFCQCCKPEGYDTLNVSLKCEDEYVIQKQIRTPLSCACTPCSAHSAPAKG